MYLERLEKNHINTSSGEPVRFQTGKPQIRGRNSNRMIPSFRPEFFGGSKRREDKKTNEVVRYSISVIIKIT
jgi:hypothetical protein